jgi:hypothetical protein
MKGDGFRWKQIDAASDLGAVAANLTGVFVLEGVADVEVVLGIQG